jgi:hypothetical protein
LLAFVIAISGAFAFSKAPADKPVTQFIGYIKNSNGSCTQTAVMCQDVFNNDPCVSGATHLFKLNTTTCPNQLWRIPE